MRAILAIDQGTTNSKAVLVSEKGEIVGRGSAPVGISYPKPGWVEQDPRRLYASVCEAVDACLKAGPDVTIEAVAISNQRESVTAWDADTGEALGPVVSWQCRRTAQDCERLVAEGHLDRVQALTGLPLDPMFPGSKFRWLLDRIAASRSVRLGTIDSWLIHCLTGGRRHACDASNAARSQLFDLREQRWSEELGAIFGVDIALLPEVLDSSADFGRTQGLPGVPDGTPIMAAIGDSHAALFGHGAFKPGDGKVTFGTGSSVMTTLSHFIPPRNGVTTTVAWRIGGKPTFAFEGNILVCAASLPWMADILGLADVAALVELAASAEPGGPGFVPAFVGLGAPYWNADARALFSQINFNTTRAQMARSVTDSIAFQVHDVIAAMRTQSGGALGALYVDGGPSQNRFLMQCVANLIEHPVIQCEAPEASALGAAYLAGLSLGLWRDLGIVAELPRNTAIIEPQAVDRAGLFDSWNDALARSTSRETKAKGE
ncbi:FGGY-family carbohydrate kinase [Rhizobium hidalgonense]|uniref:FGGY-family carbohydrate kinase n=1 Tax=Rhizobium hidalgonense TaxID=1538159 RepID=A0A2A6KLU8_9HYPH|nr:FGGY-family carbohydrate kinase [Rhizobium hidalgonense]MDR9771420.1 FGGY-family carbohydrate kinase [Rhizobium hidalgonense]MDR9809023.1 FGGY-family carbohydrate kinase [Rhizobium hidalgonense]MDR9818549.1 FGGY-family carbohydrate kinase [Rhizobium hidalgonense]PDT25412.1 glycerol kinase [Rhizobium hidalgonense]PON07546.1 glycerol kinase [Rhizobium hidalgonense]